MTVSPHVPPAAAGPERSQRAQTWLLAVVAAILAGWALHMTAIVMVPVILSLFIVLMVAPADAWVAQRVPRWAKWLGHVAAMGIVLAALAIFAGGIWLAAERLVSGFPSLPDQLQLPSASAPNALGSAAPPAGETAMASQDGGLLAEIKGAVGGAGSALRGRMSDYAASLAQAVVGSATATLTGVIIIVFLTLLMLIEAPLWRRKLTGILGDSQKQDWGESLAVISQRLRRYLLARVVLGLATGALYTAWLWIFGVDLLVVWALLAFLLNFVPNLGSLVAGILPVLYAFVQKDAATAVLVAGGIFVIEQVMGNFVDPRVQGRQVAVSPLVILVVILLWGWVWGIAGAILAVPITIAMVITFAHIPVLRPVALLLSSEPDMEGLDRVTRSQ